MNTSFVRHPAEAGRHRVVAPKRHGALMALTGKRLLPTGIILAGGENRRIGKNKAFLKIGNKTFLDILIDKLKPFSSEIIISVKSIKEFIGSIPPIHTALLSKAVSTGWIKLVQDILPIRSSLVGIYSALRSMKSDYGFVIGCDMPSVPAKLIRYLISFVEKADVSSPCAPASPPCLGCPEGQRGEQRLDVVIPKGSNGLEPLCALYSIRCLGPMAQLIKRHDFKIIDFFPLASLSCPASQSPPEADKSACPPEGGRSGEVKVKIINLSDIKGLNNNDIFNINTIKDLQYLRNSVKNTSRGKRSRKI